MDLPQQNIAVRRVSLWTATLATVVTLSCLLARVMSPSESWLDAVTLGLFVVLTTWISLWFWIATTGFRRSWNPPSAGPRAEPAPGDDAWQLPHTAILVPVYNEAPGPVFSRIRAMRDSLRATGQHTAFDFFVLSDTTNPDVWLEEQWHWMQLANDPEDPPAVYYRRRPKNLHRKSGNIADFCERWGAHYPFMIVLDADSLMDGEVLVELSRRMAADPRLGLLQTPTLPLGADSLLSRCQQFAARLCGRLLAEGLDLFSGDGGNYWGHNAIIRTAAFTQHCGLGPLPGAPPLGGEVLSHDFVEAALMHRAGYKVRLASDLTASYEECPSTLPAFAQRDQRWCQGNLQHARILVSRGIRIENRFHFLTGIMAYLSAPLWLLFLVLSALSWLTGPPESALQSLRWTGADAAISAGVFACIMFMLLAPRMQGALLAARAPGGLTPLGGAWKLLQSLTLEFIISVLMAPIMMAFHVTFIAATLLGRRVQWNAQNRSETGVSLREAWHVHRWHTILGVATAATVALFIPAAALWLSPVIAGLVLSVPISMATSSARIGAWFKRRSFLQIPEEVLRPPVVAAYEREVDALAMRNPPQRDDMFARLLADPLLLQNHLKSLPPSAAPPAARLLVRGIASRLRRNQWRGLTPQQKHEVLVDPDALQTLHQIAWQIRVSSPSPAAQHAAG